MTMPDILCLICDANIDDSSCANIFCTYLPCTGELLSNFISLVLRVAVTELQGSYICLQCSNLFEMLEQAQWTVLNVRCEIFKIYHSNRKRKNIKQRPSSKAESNLTADIQFEKTKLDVVIRSKELKKGGSLSLIEMEEMIKQRSNESDLVKRKLNIFSTNTDTDRTIKLSSKVDKETVNDLIELDNTRLYDYNNVEIKNDEVSKGAVFHESVVAANDSNICTCICGKLLKSPMEHNVCSLKHDNHHRYQKFKDRFSDISTANIRTIKMPVQEGDCIGGIPNSENTESGDFMKADSVFLENKLQLETITRSIDFTWKEIEERVAQVKESSECSLTKLNSISQNGTETNQTQMSITPTKLLESETTKSEKYSCPTCDKICKSAADLKTHIKTHSTLRPYMCEKCGQAYKHKHALEIHVGMHNGINPFQCSFCNKCFTQKGALMRHLPIHTGEMAYQCELCGKRFRHHTSYNMHRLSHSGKKSHKCHMCDLSLLSTSHLKRHMRVHTGEKPYSCSLCGKRFAERYNLLAHQKRELHDQSENKGKKMQELKYKCAHCNLVCKSKEHLNDHTKSHSPVDNENNQFLKKIESEDNEVRQTWIQMNPAKLESFNNQTKFVFLQNPLSKITENSFAITFGDQKMSLDTTNYSTSLQVIIEPSKTTVLNSNHVPTDSTHM